LQRQRKSTLHKRQGKRTENGKTRAREKKTENKRRISCTSFPPAISARKATTPGPPLPAETSLPREEREWNRNGKEASLSHRGSLDRMWGGEDCVSGRRVAHNSGETGEGGILVLSKMTATCTTEPKAARGDWKGGGGNLKGANGTAENGRRQTVKQGRYKRYKGE